MYFDEKELKKRKFTRLMQRALGIALILLGLFVGIYIGIYQCLILAIVDIINGIKSGLEAMPIAIGIVKIILGPTIAGTITQFLMTVGIALL